MNGTRLDRYVIDKPLSHSGGTASVYLASLANDPKYKVAIKMARSDPNPNISSHEDALLKWEADYLSRWDWRHPGIVRVFPTPVSGSTEYVVRATTIKNSPWYMVMEYLQGGSLAQKITEIQKFPLDWKLEMIYQVAVAVAFIHTKGFAHRDLKPDNIVFREPVSAKTVPQPVLVDFALLSDGIDKRDIVDNSYTPQYASPERILKPMGYNLGDEVLPSDIWSLGVIIYEILTGKTMFKGDKDQVRTTMIRGSLQPQLPDDDPRYHMLAAYIRGMLNKDPEKRPTIKQVVYALEEEFLPPRLPA